MAGKMLDDMCGFMKWGAINLLLIVFCQVTIFIIRKYFTPLHEYRHNSVEI